MKPLLTDLWPQFAEDAEFRSAFGGAVVDKVLANRQHRLITVVYSAPAPAPRAACDRLALSLAPLFKGFSLRVRGLFPYESLTPQAVLDLVQELKEEGVPINGFFDGASARLEGDNILLTLCNGETILRQIEFDKKLAEKIAQATGRTPNVHFSCAEAIDAQELEKKMMEKTPVKVFKAKKELPALQVPGLALEDVPTQVVYGHVFKPDKPTPLQEMGQDAGKVTVWGDVFATELKGNYYKIYSISITDYTGSINVKLRLQQNENSDRLDELKKGDTLVIRGRCEYDRFERDYVIMPDDVLKTARKQRTDDAEGEKRVELHLHTKLSSMDGFCDPAAAVKMAHRMGHRAIAITDHGVVQGFPEAMLAVDDIHKKDPDFKLIYGCEAYFVDDMVPVVYGNQDVPMQGSFVVFDLETTGLSPQDCAITEIGAVVVENGEIGESYNSFANPGVHIPENITKLTGITDDMVKDAPGQEQAVRDFMHFVNGRILVAHNAHGFDIRFLKVACERYGIPFQVTYIDTLPLAQSI